MKIKFEFSGPLAEALTLAADVAFPERPESQRRAVFIQAGVLDMVRMVGVGMFGPVSDAATETMGQIKQDWEATFNNDDPTTWGIREVLPNE